MHQGRLGTHVEWCASPNFTERRGGGRPAMVVLHYTGMEDAAAARERLCDPAFEVSAHILIDPTGGVLQLVDLTQRAWHAGRSRWGAIDDVNSWSIGIELVNPGPLTGLPPFPDAQMRALEAVLAEIRAQWRIPPERIVGHSCIAPGRKVDPGPKFDWRRLAMRGHCVWLPPPMVDATGRADAERFRTAASAFGFPTDADVGWTPDLLAVWKSFALRFLAPSQLSLAQPDR